MNIRGCPLWTREGAHSIVQLPGGSWWLLTVAGEGLVMFLLWCRLRHVGKALNNAIHARASSLG